jgi:adenylate kinase
MFMIYGPAGAGKSTQGQILADKIGRKWLSAGQIIRDSHRFDDFTAAGAMIDEKILVELIRDEVNKAENEEGVGVVFDGQPGTVEQVSYLKEAGLLDNVEAIAILRVPKDELIRRLSSRGRDDDNEEVWHKKIEYFEEAGKPFFAELKKQGLNVVDVDGTGSKEEVAERLFELSKKVVQK